MRKSGTTGLSMAALMAGLGIFMSLLAFKYLPEVYRATSREDTVCHIIDAQIQEDVDAQTYQIHLNLRWEHGDVQYGTAKPELWRESPKKTSSLEYLEETYRAGNSRRCYFDEGYPSKVFPEKANLGEMLWLVCMALIGIALSGVGAIRLIRNFKRPKRYTAAMRDGVSYDYVGTEREGATDGRPAAAFWGPVFEAVGLARPDPQVFRYTGTLQNVVVHAFVAEFDDEVAALGVGHPPLTIRFDDVEGSREVYFWVRFRDVDEPIPEGKNFWVSYDRDLDARVEITGYNELAAASVLNAEARALITRLTIEKEINLYAGHQKSVALDALRIEEPEEGLKVLKDWIAWMSHVFDASGEADERLAAIALEDPIPMVRLHRLCLLHARFPESDAAKRCAEALADSSDKALALTAQVLAGDGTKAKTAAGAVAKSLIAAWEKGATSLTFAQRAMRQFMPLLPPDLDGPVLRKLVLAKNQALVEETLRIVERRPELSPDGQKALIQRLKSAPTPIALHTIHILGRLGTPDSQGAIKPYTEGEYVHTELAEAAAAAIRNIGLRHSPEDD